MANRPTYFRDEPDQQQVILLKLCNELETAPHFPGLKSYPAESEQRQWLARAGALLQQVGISEGVKYSSSMRLIAKFGNIMIEEIKGQMVDAVEKLRLDLHLSGRDDFGTVYEKGETYKFFSDLSSIISAANSSVFIVDPYFNGDAFRSLVGPTVGGLSVRLLCDRYEADVVAHSVKFNSEYGDRCEVKTSKEIHDRVVAIDGEDCWIIGASIKDGGKKPTYLIPLSPLVAPRKIAVYMNMWDGSPMAQ